MTRRQLQRLLDVHGPDPSRWPADRRHVAESVLAADPAARQTLAAARRLDGMLRRLSSATDDPAPASVERVMSALAGPLPPQRRASWGRWWPAELLDAEFSPAWQRVAALAAVATLGFALGLADISVLGGLASRLTAGARSTDDLMSTMFEPDPLPGVRR